MRLVADRSSRLWGLPPATPTDLHPLENGRAVLRYLLIAGLRDLTNSLSANGLDGPVCRWCAAKRKGSASAPLAGSDETCDLTGRRKGAGFAISRLQPMQSRSLSTSCAATVASTSAALRSDGEAVCSVERAAEG